MTFYEIIFDQLGRQTLFMLNAKNKCYTDNEKEKSASFRITGSKTVNYIKISLAPMDLYNIEFGKIHGFNYKVVKKLEGIYCDQLHELIEKYTGLATKIPNIIFKNR